MLIIGGNEVEDGTVSVRSYSEGRRGSMTPEDVRDEIVKKVENRALDVEVQRSGLRDPEDAHGEVGEDMEERGY